MYNHNTVHSSNYAQVEQAGQFFFFFSCFLILFIHQHTDMH